MESLTSADSSRRRHPRRGRRRRRRRQPGRLRLGRIARRPTSSPPPWPTPATTPASPRPTPTSCWPCPTGSRPWSSTCGTTASAARRWRRRSPWRSSWSGPPGAADPRVRQVSSADYSDSRAEVALASTTGISSVAAPDQRLPLGRRHRGGGRRDADRRRLQRRPRPGRAGARRGDGRRRAAGHPHARGAEGAARPTAPWSSTRASCPRCWR